MPVMPRWKHGAASGARGREAVFSWAPRVLVFRGFQRGFGANGAISQDCRGRPILRLAALLVRAHSMHSDGSQRGALMVRRRGGSLSGCRLHIDVTVLGDSPRKAPSSVGVQRRVSSTVISGLAEKQKAPGVVGRLGL